MTPVSLLIFSFHHLENFCISVRRQTEVKEGGKSEKCALDDVACAWVTFVKINDFGLSVHVDLFSQQVVLVV